MKNPCEILNKSPNPPKNIPSIQTLIGKQFEKILKRKYPELTYIGDDENRIPDFEHDLFYAEAKVSFFCHDYAAHIKQRQVESFKKYEKNKPVLYLVGFHNFEDSLKRLIPIKDEKKRKRILEKKMGIVHFFVVDNQTITKIWDRRNYISKRGHIHDCTLREGHLTQIINNSQIKPNGKTYNARDYYNVPKRGYSFQLPTLNKRRKISVGHILPAKLINIIDYFYN